MLPKQTLFLADRLSELLKLVGIVLKRPLLVSMALMNGPLAPLIPIGTLLSGPQLLWTRICSRNATGCLHFPAGAHRDGLHEISRVGLKCRDKERLHRHWSDVKLMVLEEAKRIGIDG